MLIKEAGFTLRDIRGTVSRNTKRRPRTDFIASIRRYCPYLEDPNPIVVETVENEAGMSEQEVLRYLTYHDEMEQIKQEEQEDSMQEARRKNGNLGNNTPSGNRGQF